MLPCSGQRSQAAQLEGPRGGLEWLALAGYDDTHFAVNITVRWSDADARSVETEAVADVLADVARASSVPLVVAVDADGAAMNVVVGIADGTALTYFPPGYAKRAIGSLHSVGDAEAAKADAWEPPLVAYFFGAYTEFPRWSVIARELGDRAIREFGENPKTPPHAVTWEPD